MVIVKCSQTGEKIRTKVQHLSKSEGGLLTLDDLQKGSSLYMEVKGKPYPAEFVAFEGMSSNFKKLLDTTQLFLTICKNFPTCFNIS